MGKKKGRGRGRPKDSQDEREERPREPGGTQRKSNDNKAEMPSRAHTVRDEQFQDAKCEYEQLAGKNDLTKQYHSDSKDYTRPERTLDGSRAVENACCSTAKVETKQNQRKIGNADVSGKNAIGTTYSLSGFHQTFSNNSSVDEQSNLLISTTQVSKPSGIRKIDIIKRPSFGTKGRQIAVVSNYFLLKGSGKDIYHYHVEITDPSAKKTKVKTIKEEKASLSTQLEIQQKRNVGKQKCREIINKLIKDKNLLRDFCPFYDGYKNLYTFRELSVGDGKSAEVSLCDDNNRTKTYIVTVKPVKKNCSGNVISLEMLNEVCSSSGEVPLEAVMAFDLILCHRNPPFDQVGVGKSFFSFSEVRKHPMDGVVEIWKGYNQSLQLTQKGPAVLINAANKAFHCSGFVIEYACNVLGFDITEGRLSPQDIHKLSKSLHAVKVEVTHLPYPRKYTVESVTKKNANDLTVDIQGRDMSVSQFFAMKYRKLRFPDLPCLSMKTTDKPTYTPMEFCVIVPGQPKLGKLNPKQTADMINMTAGDPNERYGRIMNYAKEISQKSGPYMQKGGYSMQLTPVHLTARVISPPTLAYSNVSSVQPDPRGVWRIDGKNFSESLSNAQWILISFASQETCPQKMLRRFSSAVVRASHNVGLNLCDPIEITRHDERIRAYDALLDAKNRKIEFAFVILSRSDKNHRYEEVKFIADVKLGLITQCMEDKVVQNCDKGKGTGQILNNLLSKLNIKLGGINHIFSKQPPVAMEKTIVMGADAAHSPRGSKCPSIAAVVGSIDDVPFQYAVSCKVQMNPDESKLSQEIILSMKEMTVHILQSYRKRNGYIPERIIFFRDGVSQGQFDTVLEKELTLIQEACHEVLKKVLPVTFIVVQKRHQTRFKPKRPEDGIGKYGNIPPGTTVDTDVTHPVYFDYFLCSHEGIKGTSKPAHYVILHDDNKFEADDLQGFCYDLCHVYSRCNRSISIPAPVMNAHLAAARAKKYIDWHLSNDADSSSGYSNEEPSVSQEVIDLINNMSEISTPMFFI